MPKWYQVIMRDPLASVLVRMGEDLTQFRVPTLSLKLVSEHWYQETINRKLSAKEIGEEAERYYKQINFRLTYNA